MKKTRNKWAGIDRGPGYRLENKGRPAKFLIPSHKLLQMVGRVSIETRIHNFLMEKFVGYTRPDTLYRGCWRNDDGTVFQDECRLYRVSFVGKYRIPELLIELGNLARLIGEECLYFEAGQYAGLLYPERMTVRRTNSQKELT